MVILKKSKFENGHIEKSTFEKMVILKNQHFEHGHIEKINMFENGHIEEINILKMVILKKSTFENAHGKIHDKRLPPSVFSAHGL